MKRQSLLIADSNMSKGGSRDGTRSTFDGITTAESERVEFDPPQPTETPFCLQTDDTASVASSNYTLTEGIDVIFGKKSSASSSKSSSQRSVSSPRNSFRAWIKMQSGRVVHHSIFKRLMLICILLCSILLGVSTLDFIVKDESRRYFVEYVLRLFQIVFTGEWVVVMLHYQVRLFRNPWLLLDTLILIIAWASLSPTPLIFRAVRILRALRQASGVTPELTLITKALLRVLPSIGAILVLMALLFYIFAVLLVRNLTDMSTGVTDYFGDLGTALLTLSQLLTHDNWLDMTRDVLAYHPWVILYFGIFLVLGGVLGMGLVVACSVLALQRVHEERLRLVDSSATSSGSPHSARASASANAELLPESTAYPTIHNNDQQRRQKQLAMTVQQLSDNVDQILRLQISLEKSIKLLEQKKDTLTADTSAQVKSVRRHTTGIGPTPTA